MKGEPADDIRENIVNYSDEGGGEGDHGGYDLSVFFHAGFPSISRGKDDFQKEAAGSPSE